jgi:1-acyl-sn-glycerol-3-phosphate acyltransferase
MNLFRYLHTFYAFVVFCIVFFLLFPFFLVPIFFPKQHYLVGVLNRVWAYVTFPLVLISFKIEVRGNLDRTKQYVFCPNHFSYLDIASMGFNPINAIFVGKSDMENVPLFGYMYRKLHITVNRASLSSKYNTLKRSMQAIDEGKSLVIFPEGGITSQNPPQMSRFKDGAFRVAIEKQIAIVPVTIPNNWILLPDRMPLLLRLGVMKIIFHEPIATLGMTLQQVDNLKEQVFSLIDNELRK